MLRPKKKIAIVYGHDQKVLKFIEKKIGEYEEQGYRVEPKILTSKELRIKKGLIFEGLMDLFKDIDAAIVLMTDDDLGISKKELEKIRKSAIELSGSEIINRLKSRARQNVIFELGYIIALVGEGNYRIFAKEHIEIPSDIQGRYLDRNFDRRNIAKIIKELIEENLKLKNRPSPLDDDSYKIDYSDLQAAKEKVLDLWEHEYNQFDNDKDRLVFLFERIVFDAYYQRQDWWQKKYRSLSSSDKKVELGKKLLEEITKYIRAWRTHENVDENMVFSSANKLKEILDRIDNFEPINPVVKIVSYDYLGLACHKVGMLQKLKTEERLKYLDWSKEALSQTIEIADKFDDNQLSLWLGYATFNLGRTFYEICNLKYSDEADLLWRKMFETAISIREGWTRNPYTLPIEIEEGLTTEYLHAKAERIKRARVDKDNSPIEKFPYAVDENFIKQAKQEYEKWERDPKQIRVRLAKNLNESWGVIKERFQHLGL
jgi:predicted nucleotide-binding protein